MLFKKVIAAAALSITLLVASPAFAYEVKPGDTMYKIARNNGLSLAALAAINPEIENLSRIYPGQTIRTKANNTGSVKVSEVKSSVSSSYSATAQAGEAGLLARLIHAEAQGETISGKIAVGEVVLNRVRDSRFPGSITAVINQPGQFSPVSSGSINNVPTAEAVKAANAALAGSNLTGGAVFFYNPATATNRWLDGLQTTTVIGNHTFKK